MGLNRNRGIMEWMREDIGLVNLACYSGVGIVGLILVDLVFNRGSFIRWVIALLRSKRGYIGGNTLTCYVRKRPDTNLGGADVELWKKVRKEMARKHTTDLKILEVDEMPRDQSVITFIICPVISRVASNVEHALKGIVSQKNMVLLLFHPVAPHVSFSGNTKWVLVEPKHQALGDIVDVVMWSTGAGGSLYHCPLNSDAVNQICDFIQWHSLTPK